MENLRTPYGAQYDHWVGRIAADGVNQSPLGKMLGVDEREWILLHVVVFISGGSQTLTGYGVRAADWTFETLTAHANQTGKLELTKLTETREDLHGHSDTNPPGLPVQQVTWVGDLIVYGFKRITLTFESWSEGFEEHVEFGCVDSIVPDDE